MKPADCTKETESDPCKIYKSHFIIAYKLIEKLKAHLFTTQFNQSSIPYNRNS